MDKAMERNSAHKWVKYAPAWVPLILTILGWVFIGGQLFAQQGTNTQVSSDNQLHILKLTNRVNTLESSDLNQNARLDKMEDAILGIYDIKNSVDLIKNDQRHIQLGVQRVEDEVKDIRNKMYNSSTPTPTE